MSARYEFLDGATLVTDSDELAEIDSEINWTDRVALVLGDPYGTAGVLVGTREQLAAELRSYLTLVEIPEA